MPPQSVPVSVIIPCYRCASTIERAVASVSCQTHKPAEVILVDDASGDDTLAVLNRLALANPELIKIVTLKENGGAASARNAGWNSATQPYIAFLDADDAWHPKKIEIQYAYMSLHPEVTLSGHQHRIITQPEKLPDWGIESFQARPLSRSAMLLSNKLVTPSVMLNRDVPNRFFDGKRHVDDHLLWLELICGGHKLVKLSAEMVSIYKLLFGVGGLSSQLWLMEKGELDTYKSLYDQDLINIGLWFCLSLYSLLKFGRRLIIYWGYLRWKI